MAAAVGAGTMLAVPGTQRRHLALIRKAQSCAVPTISVVPRAAPWRLPLFYGRLTDWLNKLKALSVKVRGRDSLGQAPMLGHGVGVPKFYLDSDG